MTDKFIEKAKLVHGDKYDYSKVDYINNKKKVIIICKIHGEFEQQPNNHTSSKQDCKKCSFISNGLSKKNNKEELIEKAIKIHGDKYDYSKVEYKNNRTKVIIICKEHGEFEQILSNHIKGSICHKCSGMFKPTKKEFIEKARLLHGDKYDYSKVEYVNALSKIIIICKQHGEFTQKPNNHISLKNGCPKCVGRNRTTEEFILKSKIIHGDTYDYSKVEYVKSHTKVIIICKIHGEFQQTPDRHTNQKQGCKICGDVKGSLIRTSTTEEFIEKSIKFHGNKYDYSKVVYINNHFKVIIICKIHGEFQQIPNSHLSGEGCRECQYLNNGNKFRKSQDDFIKKAIEIHGDKYNYSKVDYLTCMIKVIIICKIHGDFEQTPLAHTGHQQSGCPKCNLQFHISKKQIQWLEFISKMHNIIIQHGENNEEYKIPNTRFKADGYCQETNTIYEFHGDYWHGNPYIYDVNEKTYFNKTFGELYEKTLKKEQQIKELGYNLVVMWENDWDKINKSIRTLQRKYKLNTL